MEIIKLNEYYSIVSPHEDWEYRGNIDYQPKYSIRLNLTINDKENEGLCGDIYYNIGQEKISSISFNNIPKEKEEIFTKYANQIIEEVLEYFNFI